MRALGVILWFVVVTAVLSLPTPPQPTAVPNRLRERTARLLNQLRHYEMVIPTMVNDREEHISYALGVTEPTERRHKREVTTPSESKRIYYKIYAYGKTFHFNLTLNDEIVSRNFVVENRGQFGKIKRHRSFKNCHYLGYSRKPHRSRAAISNCFGLHGVFSTDDDVYFVEPLWNHTNTIDVEGHPHVVYKRSAIKLPEGANHCGVEDKINHKIAWFLKKWSRRRHNDINHRQRKFQRHSKKKLRRHYRKRRSIMPNEQPTCQFSKPSNHHICDNNGCGLNYTVDRQLCHIQKPNFISMSPESIRVRRSVSRERHVETLVVVDKMMVNYHGPHEIEPYVLTIMNIVAKLYHDSSIGNAINIIVTRLVLLSEDQPTLLINHHADRSLDSFCRWQKDINPPEQENKVQSKGIAHHDNAVLLTRYDICTYKNKPCGTLGLAPVAGMCEEDRSCSINEDIGLASAFTIAHEIGHNFGMQHDGAGNQCGTPGHEPARIMAAQLTKDTSPFLWSSCSREYVTNFLDSGSGRCLENTPPKRDFKFPKALPGEQHDVNHQCQLQFGKTSRACKPLEVCHELWCFNLRKTCVTNSIPAAEGSHCDLPSTTDTGWCYRGNCSTTKARPDVVDGRWGTWSGWGSCSRTCGGGVESSERECDKPRPQHGGKYCVGDRKRYRSCRTYDCPKNSTDFREVQCKSYDKAPFRGNHYHWKPFTGIQVKPCALNCLADGYNFYTERSPKVIDGTPCFSDQLDMCINGECRHVGCDRILASSTHEDKCRVCGGDGTTCRTITGLFDKPLPKGAYQEILKIPKGAVHITVEEATTSKNYLALKDEEDKYYINGEWTIDWPRKFPVAGTIIHYTRTKNEPECLYALGPTNQNLQVTLLLQEENLGIRYEYNIAINRNNSKPPNLQYIWQLSPWSKCSVSCGKGAISSVAVCVKKEDTVQIDERYCASSLRPSDLLKHCSRKSCPPIWVTGDWSECSAACGGGKRTRTVKCGHQEETKQSTVKESDCGKDRPAFKQSCNEQDCPAVWFADEWSQCPPLCGIGVRKRHVYCMSSDGQDYHEESHCEARKKPRTETRCSNRECPTPTWATGDWGQCSTTCGKGQQRRNVQCRTYTGDASRDCNRYMKPAMVQDCEGACDDEGDDECSDKYRVAYCPLVLRFNFCNRQYFQNMCCKTCTAAGHPRRHG